MLHEDNPGHMAAASWQMQSENGVGGDVSSKPLDFMARASRGHIGRQVCWPPKPEYGEVLAEEDSSNQVSMEVQQQALQQVNGQMQQQSMMNSSSSSSRQEVRSTVSQSSSSFSQESTSYQATCTQQQHSYSNTQQQEAVQSGSSHHLEQEVYSNTQQQEAELSGSSHHLEQEVYSNTQQQEAVLSGSSHHLEQEVYSNTQQQEVLQSGSNHHLEQEVYNNTQIQEAVNSEQGVSQSESSQQIELSRQQQQQEYMVQQQSESRQQLDQRRLEKQRYMAQERLEQAMAQEQLEQASSQPSSENYMSMSMPTNSSEQINLPVQNNSATNITPNSTHYMNGNSLVVDSNSTHYMNGNSLVVDSNNHMANTSHSQSDSPPVGFHITDSTNYLNQSGVYHAVPAQATGTTFGSTSGSTTVWPPQPSDVGDRPVVANGPTPTVTTQFPAGFKMRDQAPVQQTPPAMILSQPAFKISQPLKKKGDSTWPPKGDNVVTQEQVREFTKPKGGKRDYGEFFAQNALPQTFCSYRAPPGTQHHGEDGTGVSEM